MEPMKWDAAYILHIKDMDEEHRRLFDIINRLIQFDFQSSERSEMVYNTLSELIDYIEYHFTMEEKLMIDEMYPEYAIHRREHIDFVQRITIFSKRYNTSSAELLSDILTYLKNWLEEHILKVDRQLAEFLLQKT